MTAKQMTLMKSIKKILFILFLNILYINSYSQEKLDCFTIIAGKNATDNASVLFAHNEDDYGEHIVNYYEVPRLKHSADETVFLKSSNKIQQISETNKYFWLEIPGMTFADAFMNEHGVCIASNACSSKEKKPKLTDGGISYNLRKIMAERALTAKHAVKIAGKLIDELGYNSSGRTYSIADPNEAWVLSVVNGKHWIAQRLDDDKVMIIPNYYTITNINLSDTNNFLGSEDIIEYAVKKSWYNPDNDGDFNFRKAYSAENTLNSINNIARKWAALNILSAKKYNINDEFPFAFIPEKKISKELLMQVLRNHYENTKFETKNKNPHKNKISTICSNTNQFAFVAELRNFMPTEIGSIMWVAPRRPCKQAFIPWYCGITTLSENYFSYNFSYASENHFKKNAFKNIDNLAFLKFKKFTENVDNDYSNSLSKIKRRNKIFEKKLIKKQKKFEGKVLKIYQKDKRKAKIMLTKYSEKAALKALRIIK